MYNFGYLDQVAGLAAALAAMFATPGHARMRPVRRYEHLIHTRCDLP